jgi:hypothetical protein
VHGNSARPMVFAVGPDNSAFKKLMAVAKEALKSDFDVVPWYDISKSGSITERIVEHILDAFCILADLRDDNPNVYYEVGLAHAFERPVIPFIKPDTRPPVDVGDQSSIAVPVKEDGVNIDNPEGLEGRIQNAISNLEPGSTRTAIAAVRTRRELAAARKRGAGPVQSSSLEKLRDAWMDLARQRRLTALSADVIMPGDPVIHTLLGAGIITGIGPSGSADQTVIIRFDDGESILPMSAQGLFLLRPLGT